MSYDNDFGVYEYVFEVNDSNGHICIYDDYLVNQDAHIKIFVFHYEIHLKSVPLRDGDTNNNHQDCLKLNYVTINYNDAMIYYP